MRASKCTHPKAHAMKIARIYIRCSTVEQDTTRQRRLIADAKAQGYYVAGVYEEKASGATLERVELQRLLSDLQPGDVIIAEHIDRLTRLPLRQACELMAAIEKKGARISVPGVIDLAEITNAAGSDVARVVLETMQAMMVKIMMAQANHDYETRRERQAQGIAQTKRDEPHKYKGKPANTALHARILELLGEGKSIRKVAELLDCNPSTVQRVKKAAGI